MFDSKDDYRNGIGARDDGEDPLQVGRGIILGLVLGSLLWAALIGGVVYVIK